MISALAAGHLAQQLLMRKYLDLVIQIFIKVRLTFLRLQNLFILTCPYFVSASKLITYLF